MANPSSDIRQAPRRQAPRRRFRWVRWLLWSFCGLLVLLAIPVAKELFERRQAESDLETIIAELDRTDPRWRLEDVEADRIKVPEDKNSARIVVEVQRLMPKNPAFALHTEWDYVPFAITLRQDQADQLAAELKPLRAALEKARSLKDYPLGRHRLNYSADWFGTLIDDQAKVREVGMLLHMDVALLVFQKDMEKAWESNRALLNAGKSLGDEPSMISMLIRMAMDLHAMRGMERILGQGELYKRQLQERQESFENEMEAPLFLIAMRGERAGIHHLLTGIETGNISLFQFLRNTSEKGAGIGSWWDSISEFFARSMVLKSHATLLRFETSFIRAATLPPTQRYPSLKEIDAAFKDEVLPDDKTQIMSRLLFPSVVKIGFAEQRTHSRLACAATALAAERFRLQTRRWPKSLEELVESGLLKRVPVDLYNGKPLGFRRAPDGLVIFSVGADGKGDGKALDEKPRGVLNSGDLPDTGTRIEFRLWDVARRRQKPPPKENEVMDD